MVVAEPVKVFNVEVFVVDTPECRNKETGREVRARVSPFEEKVPLEEIVGELARRTAELGADTLHSIRVLSVIPFRGAEVTGIAIRCVKDASPPQNGALVPPLNEALVAIVKTAKTARVFNFPDSALLGPDRSADRVTLVAAGEIGGAALERLRALIFSPEGFDLTPGLAKSCPFVPNIGFQFADGREEAWWLVSYRCETAMLARRTDDWRKVPAINLKPETVKAFQQLAR